MCSGWLYKWLLVLPVLGLRLHLVACARAGCVSGCLYTGSLHNCLLVFGAECMTACTCSGWLYNLLHCDVVKACVDQMKAVSWKQVNAIPKRLGRGLVGWSTSLLLCFPLACPLLPVGF